jgi:hypothetical protein
MAGASALGGLAGGGLAAGAPKMIQAVAPAVGRILGTGAVGAMAAPEGRQLQGGLSAAGGAALGEGLGAAISKGLQQVAHPLIKRAAKEGFEAAETQRKGTWEGLNEIARQLWDASQAKGQAFNKSMQKSLDMIGVSQVADKVGKILPELSVFGDDLFALSRTKAGKVAIDRVFDTAKEEIKRRIGGGKAQWIQIPTLSPDRMSLDDAMAALTRQGGHVGKGVGLERSASQSMGAFDYGKARAEMVSELNRLDPAHEAGQIWDGVMKARSAARAYMTLVSKSLDPSGVLDTRKLATNVNKMAQALETKMGPYYDEIEGALLAGQKAPVAIAPKTKLPDPVPYDAPRFEPKAFEPRGRMETLLSGPQSPTFRLGSRQLPSSVPPRAQVPLTAGTGAAMSGNLPPSILGYGLMGAEALAEHIPRIPGLSRRRRDDTWDSRD